MSARTERELLELAAKAAGINRVWYSWEMTGEWGLAADDPDGGIWNPLISDGDALRLAVKLGIGCYSIRGASWADDNGKIYRELHNGDQYAATRRAIVRAAAEVGASLP